MNGDPNPPIFDPGLQPERTELAWRRTAMSMGVGALVAMRLLPPILGHPAWAAVGAAGVVYSAGTWFSARRRHRQVYRALMSPPGTERIRLPGAGPMLAMAAGVGLMALGGIAVVVRLAVAR